MSVFNTTTWALCLALGAGAAVAQDAAKPAAPADGAKAAVTLQECREMAATKKEGMAKDEATMKKEAACSELMRKENNRAGTAAPEPAKK